MSAVFGILQSQYDIGSNSMKKIKDSLECYPFDYLDYSSFDNVYLGCGMQFITPESLNEKLPFIDEANNLFITADAIIDNRQELCEKLSIQDNSRSITDSELILAAYIKWGHKCPFYLIGDFAFVIWDKKKKELFCARDPMGRRTLYYHHTSVSFSFCTVTKPLLSLLEKPDLNERWLTDFLAIPGPPHISESRETIFKDIYSLPPAHYLVCKDSKVRIRQYWDISRDIKPIRFKSDHEYEEAFRKVMAEAVKSSVRCVGEVAVMLSSGLDSTTVSCFASAELKKQGKKLYSFTSVPMDGYVSDLKNYAIVDESEIVREFVKSFDNIEDEYIKSEGKHPLSDVDRFIRIFEQPYKYYRNLFWIDSISEAASQKKCKVILDGHFGNYSISFGSLYNYYLTLLKKCRFLRFLQEMRHTSNEVNIPMLKVVKIVLKGILPDEVFYLLKGKLRFEKNSIIDHYAIINREMMNKWNVKKRLNRTWIKNLGKLMDLKASRLTGANLEYFSHLGAFDTALSLSRGHINRDPTKDRRVVEFTFGITYDQFVRDGNNRFLLRRAMKGILIDKIRMNDYHIGRQSADWAQRLLPLLGDILEEADEIITNDIVMTYIDKDRLTTYINKLKSMSTDDMKKEEYKNILDVLVKTIIFSRFVKTWNNLIS